MNTFQYSGHDLTPWFWRSKDKPVHDGVYLVLWVPRGGSTQRTMYSRWYAGQWCVTCMDINSAAMHTQPTHGRVTAWRGLTTRRTFASETAADLLTRAIYLLNEAIKEMGHAARS